MDTINKDLLDRAHARMTSARRDELRHLLEVQGVAKAVYLRSPEAIEELTEMVARWEYEDRGLEPPPAAAPSEGAAQEDPATNPFLITRTTYELNRSTRGRMLNVDESLYNKGDLKVVVALAQYYLTAEDLRLLAKDALLLAEAMGPVAKSIEETL